MLYVDSFKANRLNGTYLLSPKLKTNGKLMMADDKSKVYAYDSWLLNFAISDRITRTTEQCLLSESYRSGIGEKRNFGKLVRLFSCEEFLFGHFQHRVAGYYFLGKLVPRRSGPAY